MTALYEVLETRAEGLSISIDKLSSGNVMKPSLLSPEWTDVKSTKHRQCPIKLLCCEHPA